MGNLKGSLYLCTPARDDLAEFITQCIQGGVDVVQLREKRLADKELYRVAVECCQVCRELGVPFFVNDRADIALACGADGVHVGQDDLGVDKVRALVGSDLMVGISTHAPQEFDTAITLDVNYISVGPVVPTPTKLGRLGTGLEYVTYATSKWTNPIFVTGGVTPDSVPDYYRAGARCFVVVRYLTESSSPKQAALRLRESINQVSL